MVVAVMVVKLDNVVAPVAVTDVVVMRIIAAEIKYF
tara:strand:- start:233 stop:340 length:108 start_codon:yes stop_codon:yes gene_type:complete